MPTSPSGAQVWRDYVTDGVPATGVHKVYKPDIRRWSTAVEQRLELASTAAKLYATRAALYADLTEDAATLAWVYGDTTTAHNGLYSKVGVSGSGSWSRLGDLPYSFVKMSDAGAGTANAIQVTSSIPTSDSVLRISNVYEANTGNVTISENGGAAKALLTNSGSQIAPGGLVAGMMIAYLDNGTSFRLMSDQASAAVLAGAEDVLADVQSIAATFQPFSKVSATVGGGTQSIDTGNAAAIAAQIHLYLDGVYQHASTWSVTAGVITPVGGSWPSALAEVHYVPAMTLENVPPDGSVTIDKFSTDALALINQGGEAPIFQTDLPFGHAGFRVLRGERYDAHYGLPNGWLVFPSGKWTLIYRRASSHAVTDGAQIRAADSYDQGATLVNDRLIYTDPTHDARPDAPRLFANGRSGFIVNRQDEGTTHFSPLLIYSDDEFETFSTKVLTTTSPYTFQSNGGILDFPTSQGGDDMEGFIAYGFVSAGSYGRISTDDNWETYTVAGGVANLTHTPATGTAITTLSEWAGARVPGEDKWIFYLRCQDSGGWRDEAACFVTTDMLNWGSAVPSNISLGGNPPCCFSDPDTNKFHFVAFGRGGRGIDGYDHHMLIATADADELWAVNGDWSALSPAVTWSVVAPVPNWATGYMAPVKVGDHWVATFVCGEPGTAGGDRSILAMIGNFVPSATDESKWQEAFRWNAIFKGIRAGFSSTTNPPASAYFTAGVDSATVGFLGYNAGSTTRTFYAVYNSNGDIGGVDGGGTATTFRTSSDGRLKVLRNGVEEEIDLDAVWGAIEPLAYTMLSGVTLQETEGRHFGMIAQDLHTVLPQAVTVGTGEPGEPGFRPWGIDYSKVVPIIIARQKQFERRVTDRLAALEGAA